MPSETRTLLGWFYREAFPKGTLDFDSLLHEAVRASLGKSNIDTEPYVQRNRKRFWNELLLSLDLDAKAGRSVLFEVKDIYSRKLIWLPSNLNIVDSKRDRQNRLHLAARPHITRAIDDLSDREYEALGCVICELIGGTNVLLTPRGNERGVDFLATVHMVGKCHVFSGSHRLYRIVGQAKKYEAKVEFKELQRLNDTLNEIKYQTPDMQRIIPPWFHLASGPIVGWLIAHNGFQTGGISYAKSHGIMISDTHDLSEIVALSRKLDDTFQRKQWGDILKRRIKPYLEPI
jgi:hypothetical protein